MICPEEGDNPEKSGLIPRILLRLRSKEERFSSIRRGAPLWEELAAYQVVGGVKAYQAEDG